MAATLFLIRSGSATRFLQLNEAVHVNFPPAISQSATGYSSMWNRVSYVLFLNQNHSAWGADSLIGSPAVEYLPETLEGKVGPPEIQDKRGA